MATKKKVENQVLDEAADKIDRSQTYNPLAAALRENDKKNLFKTDITTAFLKTGFPLFDYYFGSVINVHDDIGKIVRQEPRVGQAAGSFNMILGATGSGKTTLATQIAANIIRQYPYSNVLHYDCENRFNISRCETITKLPASYFGLGDNMERYTIKGGAIDLGGIQEAIIQLCATKKRLKDQLLVDSGYKDEFNRPVIIYQPSIIIIDSMAQVLGETFSVNSEKEINDATKMRTNTEGARDAKSIRGFLKDIIPYCKETNIIIYAINHINTNMSMNAFLPVAKQQYYLKADESIPGGKAMQYDAFNMIKLTGKVADDFTEDSDGFAGHMVMVEPIKTSANQSGNNSKGISFELVFSHNQGFDNLRSLIMYGKDNGIIEGNKSRLKFKGDDSFTFTFKNVYKESKEKPIWENIKKFIIPELETHLSYVDPTEMEFDERSLDY